MNVWETMIYDISSPSLSSDQKILLLNDHQCYVSTCCLWITASLFWWMAEGWSCKDTNVSLKLLSSLWWKERKETR